MILKDNDIIFIPPVEKRVEITGEFKRAGLFEIKAKETLSELIRFAGGYTVNSYLSKLQIYRKTQQGSKIIDIPLDEAKNTILQNGDEVRNGSILDLFENRVSILGAVTRPGAYEWTENMMLSDLVMKADSITADAYLKEGHIIRFNPDLTQQLVTFNLNDVLSGAADYPIFQEDIITIKSNFQMLENNTFTVAGHVISPGTFTYMNSITVSDAIYLANGLREGAVENGHVIRIKPDRTYTFIYFNIEDVFLGPSMVFTNVINPRSAVNRKNEYSKTHVGEGATIGANATIVCGNNIGKFAFIGAGAVIIKEVPAYSLWVGNPAKQIGWMSEYGHRLTFNEKGNATCPESGEVYKLKDNQVSKTSKS